MRVAGCISLILLTACAPLIQSDRPRPEVTFNHALISLDQGDYRAAYENLSWIHQHYWNRPIGERALLAMTAVELDPWNPGRRLGVGADLGARHERLPTATAWNTPVARTLHRLALELVSMEERLADLEGEIARADRERAAAIAEREEARREAARAADRARRAEADAAAARRAAPAPAAAAAPRAPASDADLRRERDRLAGEVTALRRQLAEQQQELDRIRQTLSP